jgi:hypothetical protein
MKHKHSSSVKRRHATVPVASSKDVAEGNSNNCYPFPPFSYIYPFPLSPIFTLSPFLLYLPFPPFSHAIYFPISFRHQR